jgi:hypothetical protein
VLQSYTVGLWSLHPRWFSLLEAAQFYDPYWRSWVRLLQWIAHNLNGGDEEAQKVQAKVAEILAKQEQAAVEGASAANLQEQEKLKIEQLRKASGNLMTLAATLASDNNGLNMRVLLEVVRLTWSSIVGRKCRMWSILGVMG